MPRIAAAALTLPLVCCRVAVMSSASNSLRVVPTGIRQAKRDCGLAELTPSAAAWGSRVTGTSLSAVSGREQPHNGHRGIRRHSPRLWSEYVPDVEPWHAAGR